MAPSILKKVTAASRSKTTERRKAKRKSVKLLTAFRYLNANQELHTGFVRTLNLSTVGALLESPDEFKVGEPLSIEFLLDNNRIAQADVRVTRVTKEDKFYHIAVEFTRVSTRARRLIEQQISQ
ncbi:MAG: PilZ domain-containing protein [Anaerolineae bacterium]|nr:PilZ domain-containing protein [Anaerolineae bacterium]